MKLILFSHPSLKKKELAVLSSLEADAIAAFHLRKPHWGFKDLAFHLSQIPESLLNKTVLHGNYSLAADFPVKGIHLTEKNRARYHKGQLDLLPGIPLISTSYHSIFQLMSAKPEFQYVFLSPVFDSISKDGHFAAFDLGVLKQVIPKVKHDVIALGGIHGAKIRICKAIGFEGVAVLGAVWKSSDPLEAIQSLANLT